MSKEFDEVQDDIDREKERTALLARLFFAGVLSAAAWERAMRDETQDQYTRAFLRGRGGLEAMTERDWGDLRGMLTRQFGFLAAFAATLGGLSEAETSARSALYIQSATHAYSLGAQRARGLPDLPAHPGDGSTPCGVNCRCEWIISDRDDEGWDCTWRVDSAAESCAECVRRGAEWNPLVVRP